MKITFIYHSSFAVELENCVLVFDYYGEGQLPTIPENKKIYFLNSHAHPDHFKREILEPVSYTHLEPLSTPVTRRKAMHGLPAMRPTESGNWP